MNILINVSGTVYSLPLTGEVILTDNPPSSIRCVGIDNPQDKGIRRRDFHKQRQERVFLLVPAAPSFTTIKSISDILKDSCYQTVRRALIALEQQGRVTSVEVKSNRSGIKNARRWMRT